MGKIKAFFRNKWVGFTLASLLYTLWFVVWTGNLWLLLGLVVIFDLYISKFFYRYVWCHNVRLCQRSKTYKTVYEWVNAIIFATVVASLVHIFIFQMYVIPTSSMEKSLLIGDYLYVSKVTYGPQMPNTPLSFPFVHHTMPFSQTKKSFSEAVKWPYHRLKGLRRIKRNDVVVFNFPAGDTVLLENQAVTYYDVLREYQRTLGARAGLEKLFRDYTVITRPVDKRENYIKRCVAIAGDSLKIVGGEVYVNDEPQAPVAGKQYMYTVMTSSPLSKYAIDKLGITEWSGGNGSNYYMLLDDERAEELRRMGNVLAVERFIYEEPNREVYPHDLTLGWNQDNYGPIWIPARGATIPLTPENMRLYRRCIEVYEGNRVEELPDGRVLLNGQPAAEYTFRMNYYWMMGDNRLIHQPEISVDFDAVYTDGQVGVGIEETESDPIKMIGKEVKLDGTLRWKFMQSESMHNTVPVTTGHSTYYAYTELYFDEATTMLVAIGTDDSGRVWINGKDVWRDYGTSWYNIDEHITPFQFRQGWNRILVRLENGGGGACGFSFLIIPQE